MLDLVVRPEYGGGSECLLKIFSDVKPCLDCIKLKELLQKMAFTYPFEASVGFYLQHGGYREDQYNLFKSSNMDFDFYLENEIEDAEYDMDWQLFYPKGLLAASQ
jgi:hypothetical protein